jgi:anti-anti-sigma factor
MKAATLDANDALNLSGSLDIYGVEEARRAILDHLAGAKELVIDLGKVEGCDAAGAQLLCAAYKSALAAGKVCRFKSVSSGLAECWSALGLSLDYFKNSRPDK